MDAFAHPDVKTVSLPFLCATPTKQDRCPLIGKASQAGRSIDKHGRLLVEIPLVDYPERLNDAAERVTAEVWDYSFQPQQGVGKA